MGHNFLYYCYISKQQFYKTLCIFNQLCHLSVRSVSLPESWAQQRGHQRKHVIDDVKHISRQMSNKCLS